MVRPEVYALCLDCVRAMTERLQAVPDLDALVATYRAADARSDLADAGVDLDGLPPETDPELIRDAAYQVRARELEARAALERTERAIMRARRDGARVVELWPAGRDERLPGFRRVEMNVATGAAVVRGTRMDAETGEPVFTLEAVRLDPETGGATGDAPLADEQSFTTSDTWHAAAERLRTDHLED
jgi:hypothetical protein